MKPPQPHDEKARRIHLRKPVIPSAFCSRAILKSERRSGVAMAPGRDLVILALQPLGDSKFSSTAFSRLHDDLNIVPQSDQKTHEALD